MNFRIIGLCCFFLVFMSALIPSDNYSDDNLNIPQSVKVGISNFPPFALKAADGRWEGLSIELLELIAKDMGLSYEIHEYDRLKHITEAIQKNNIDLTIQMAVTEFNETIMDLSHPYYRSGLAIAVPLQSGSISWSESVRRILSIGILKLVAMLVLLSFFAGLMIWVLERNRNREMFGDNISKGLGHGIWWAMVTMTTVGYGDKAPKTIGGRFVAVLWMFFSIFLIASYTAVITSSLTINELSGKVGGPRDLPNVRVGALVRSETIEFLAAEGLAVIPFDNLKDGLQAAANRRIDVFVDDELQLKYIIKQDFPGRLQVLPETISQYYVSMAMPPTSQLREQLNRTLVKIIAQEAWSRLKARYIGKVH